MEENLRDLLDKIYELEGLVHLALKRDDSSDDFLRLIIKKGQEVSEVCKGLTKDDKKSNISHDSSESMFPLQEYTIDEELNDEEFNNKEKQEGEKAINTSQRGKLVFSINERFRFRNELFDKSDVDFNNTLALIASMEDYEEAEEYFLNEEGFNLNNPIVVEFLEIIKRYFK